MLRISDDQKILQTLDRQSRLFLALSACLMLALDRTISVHEALGQSCKVFSAVFPEKAPEKTEKN